MQCNACSVGVDEVNAMQVEHDPVTGRESKQHLTPQMQALSNFYQALNERDMELMQRNWAHTAGTVMANPIGGINRGWNEIRAVYERVFSGSAQFWFEFHDYSYHEAGEIFYVAGRERGEYRTDSTVLQMAIRTSRIYRHIEGQWRQVHHHGSIDDPDLLAAYQQATKAKPRL
jgi:ketosteroid isomerase-like protein